MSRLVDPTLCPDCRGHLVTCDGGAVCTACHLEVTGPLAAELWTRMVAADRVVEQLRALSGQPQPIAPTTPTSPAAAPSATSALPTFPRPATGTAAAPPPRRLPAASVPFVLLSLGALCLLVAAVVFVAVAWGSLGLTGRTLVMLGVTTLFSVAAITLTRKALRGAAETLWLLVAGMLVVDLLGARSSGLLGLDVLDWRGTAALVGTALLSLGIGVAAWATGQPVRTVYGAQLVAVTGALVLTLTNAWLAEDVALATAVSVALLALLAALVRPILMPTAVGLAVLGCTSWLVVAGIGVTRAVDDTTSLWWSELRGWPLVVAAGYAATVALVPRIPVAVRPVAAGLALTPVTLLLSAPANTEDPTLSVLLGCVTLVALAAVTRFSDAVWALPAGVLGVLGGGTATLALLVEVLTSIDVPPADRGSIDSRLGDPTYLAGPWTMLVVAVAVTITLFSLTRFAGARHGAELRVLAASTLVLGAVAAVLGYPVPLWADVLALASGWLVVGAATWSQRDHVRAAPLGSAATAYFAGASLALAAGVPVLTALDGTLLVVLLTLAFALRESEPAVHGSAALAAGAALVGGWSVDGWARVLEADDTTRALVAAGFAVVVSLLASRVTQRELSRLALEGSAAVVAVAAVALAPTATTAAMVLTVVGSGLAVLTALNRDRAHVGWVSALVLGAATLIRVVEQVELPEAYTLPAAVLLVAVGAWRLSTDAQSNSFAALGSGLVLGVLPSLLLALEEPVSLRGALVAAAGVAVLAVGLRQRLAAPFEIGAATTAVLAVRHLEPYADAVPRWISLGAVGLALLLVGITWEARRRDLETAGRYLTALR